MQINELTNHQIPKPHSSISRAADDVAPKGTAQGEKKTLQVDSKLIDRLNKTQLEARAEIIENIKTRIESGEFVTRGSAESVADSILGS